MAPLKFHQYQVVGRHNPTEAEPEPKLFRMKLWATDHVRAKSKFWYFLSKLQKVKKANGQVVACNEICEKRPTKINNYALWIRYESRSGVHNAYKEYRDVTLNGAVEQMYTEMGSRHRVSKSALNIIKTSIVAPKDCKRVGSTEFHNPKIKFPFMVKGKVRPPTKSLKTTFKYTRPSPAMK